jgi:hypothetical protein
MGVEPKAHPGSFLLEFVSVITPFSISTFSSRSFGPRWLVVPAPLQIVILF